MTREEKLMIRIGRGDMGAAEELFRLLYPEILRYCLWHAPNRDLAEDAAQETFLKAIRYYDRYVHKGKGRAFLYRIAANTCVDLHRKRGEGSLEDIPEDLPCEEEGFERTDADLNFRQRIRSLPPGTTGSIAASIRSGANPAADCPGYRGAPAHRSVPAPCRAEEAQTPA